MPKITRTINIQAPRSAVWAGLADFGNISKLSAGVKSSRLTSEQSEGVGTTRHCDLEMMGATVEERITGWQEGESLDIDIYDFSKMPMVKSMGAEFRLEDAGEGTKLTASMMYDVGMGPIGWVMNAIMMKPMMAKNWSQFLAGVRHGIETGEVVNGDTPLRTQDVLAA